jgi:hypothetical protein
MYDTDPYIPRLKFNEEIYKSTKKLKIGYYTNDNFFSLAPANSRAVLEVYIFIYVYICLFLRMCFIYMHICVYMYMYMCIHIYQYCIK